MHNYPCLDQLSAAPEEAFREYISGLPEEHASKFAAAFKAAVERLNEKVAILNTIHAGDSFEEHLKTLPQVEQIKLAKKLKTQLQCIKVALARPVDLASDDFGDTLIDLHLKAKSGDLDAKAHLDSLLRHLPHDAEGSEK